MEENNNSQEKRYTTLYIVRHGETEWNTLDILQGQLDSPLTARGQEQAKELAQTLREINFDAVFSSDLLRAQRTAEVVSLERKLAVKTSQLLRERNWGQYDGRQAQIFREEARELLEKFERLSQEEQWKYKFFPDIESLEEVFGRFMTFLREVALAYPDRTILVVTHLDIMRTLLLHLGQIPIDINNMACAKIITDGVSIELAETSGITVVPK